MSRERSRGNLSPMAYVLDTTSNSSSQLSEGIDQNTLSSSSSSPSLAAALHNFDIGSGAAREHSRDIFGYPDDDSSTHMESYMEYLALLNHRHGREPMDESSGTGGSSTDVATNESLSLLTNTTNSLSFGMVSSINDENGDRTGDGSNRLTEPENNNDVTSGSSTHANDFSDVEFALIRDLYSPSASDPGSSSERRESAQSGSFADNVSEMPRGRSFRLPNLMMQRDLNCNNESDFAERRSISFHNPIRRDPSSSVRFSPQPLKLPSSTRLKITVLKWNVAASWKWTAGDETCGICRMPFEACCIECKTPGDECPLAIGTCKHAFHMHCIVKWTETQNAARPQCPLCRQEWKFAPG
ncbi:Anaphase-promoting complex subunit 11 [Dirofilaria immitis]|nr:Anaphase-promoting complex subunit 11 [Dirofilaria immitis]